MLQLRDCCTSGLNSHGKAHGSRKSSPTRSTGRRADRGDAVLPNQVKPEAFGIKGYGIAKQAKGNGMVWSSRRTGRKPTPIYEG